MQSVVCWGFFSRFPPSKIEPSQSCKRAPLFEYSHLLHSSPVVPAENARSSATLLLTRVFLLLPLPLPCLKTPTPAQDPAVTTPWQVIHSVLLMKSSEADAQPQNTLGGRTRPSSTPLKSRESIGSVPPTPQLAQEALTCKDLLASVKCVDTTYNFGWHRARDGAQADRPDLRAESTMGNNIFLVFGSPKAFCRQCIPFYTQYKHGNHLTLHIFYTMKNRRKTVSHSKSQLNKS